MIMALSQILYGCGLIRVCMKTYVIKLTEREKRALWKREGGRGEGSPLVETRLGNAFVDTVTIIDIDQ